MSKKGHYAKVCQGRSQRLSAAINSVILASISSKAPVSLVKSSATVNVNGHAVEALFDSGSSESFIAPFLVELASLPTYPCSGTVSMASTGFTTQVKGFCVVYLTYKGYTYKNVRLSVLPGLCANLILGLDFQTQHESITFNYGGPRPPLTVCNLTTLNISPPEPFANLSPDCHPIATKSRRYIQEDSKFIDAEVERLLREGIIEPSNSPWRAQVIVTKDENHKKRLAID